MLFASTFMIIASHDSMCLSFSYHFFFCILMSWFMEICYIVYENLYYTFILFFHENQM